MTHDEKEALHCDIESEGIKCNFYSKDKSNLRAHKKRVHEKPTNVNLAHVCSLCGYKTAKKFNLNKHSESCGKSATPNSIDHSCNQCHKTFPSKKSLNRHSKLHNKNNSDTPNKAFLCVVCRKTFVNLWNMERHQRKEHGLTEKGNVIENSVGIAIFTTEALVKETVTVTKRREEKISHKCDQCDYSSYKKDHLRTHMQKHEQKPERRGRKKKVGPLSERTKRRRKAEDANNLTERDVSFLGKDLRISERDLRKVVKFHKRKTKSAFNGNLIKFLKKKKQLLKGHFKTDFKEFRDKKGKSIKRNLTCSKDLEVLIEKVIKIRNIVDPLILVGCDGGLGSFLVTLVVIDRTKDYKLERFKPTGFPRLLVPAKVREIPESTHNLRVIFEEIKINELSKKYKIVGDLKVYNMLLGMQSSGSLHPCAYGYCYKVDEKGQKTNQKGQWVKGEDRTLEGNAEEAKAFAETTQKRELLQYFFNCEFQPVIVAQESTRVLDILTIPVLHTVLLGPFNTLWETLRDHFPKESNEVELRFGMKGAGAGGDFNGKTVKEIVHNESKLAHLERILPENAKIFVECLRGIAAVHNLVRFQTLDPAFENIIGEFVTKWKALEDLFGIGCTLKIHIIGTHLLDVLRETGKTLHDESDEVVEQAHFRVQHFERTHGYETSDRKMMTTNAGEKQQRMMEHLNSYHLR